MNKRKLIELRMHLGKTQKQLAQLLSTSVKTIESYEQGLRNIPPSIERQILFLLAMKQLKNNKKKVVLCWKQMKCPTERRNNCPAWEFQCGHLCWFINGTNCKSKPMKTWQSKMRICRQCKVFKSAITCF